MALEGFEPSSSPLFLQNFADKFFSDFCRQPIRKGHHSFTLPPTVSISDEKDDKPPLSPPESCSDPELCACGIVAGFRRQIHEHYGMAPDLHPHPIRCSILFVLLVRFASGSSRTSFVGSDRSAHRTEQRRRCC
jgi:hypothetical protein